MPHCPPANSKVRARARDTIHVNVSSAQDPRYLVINTFFVPTYIPNYYSKTYNMQMNSHMSCITRNGIRMAKHLTRKHSALEWIRGFLRHNPPGVYRCIPPAHFSSARAAREAHPSFPQRPPWQTERPPLCPTRHDLSRMEREPCMTGRRNLVARGWVWI